MEAEVSGTFFIIETQNENREPKALKLAVMAARAFREARFNIKWHPQTRSEVTLGKRLLQPIRTVGHRIYWHLGVLLRPAFFKSSIRQPYDRFADNENKSDWSKIFACVESDDIVLFPCASIDDVHQLFKLVPALKLDRPLACTVQIVLAEKQSDYRLADELRFLLRQLESGSPFRVISFYAWSDSIVRAATEIGYSIPDIKPFIESRNNSVFLKLLAPKLITAKHAAADVTPTILIDKFGPVVLQFTALWGKVGSNVIFDAQTRYFTDQGFFIVRVFVDHYPDFGELDRVEQLVAECVTRNCRPHLHYALYRIDNANTIRSSEFESATPVLRVAMLIADAAPVSDEEHFAWLCSRARISVVNHLLHIKLAERLTSALLILETHDIYSKLLSFHGIPHFVPPGPDSLVDRDSEERTIWASVAACVNLSPEDHKEVSKYARQSFHIKPYLNWNCPPRKWAKATEINRFSENLKIEPEFDVLLWGGWHQINIDGIIWFIEQVMPLNSRLGNIRVAIAGRVINGLPPHVLQHSQITPVGFVDSLDDIIFRNKVLVLPDRAGTGISIKAIDTFARGACFASTQSALRGLDLADTGYSPTQDASALAHDVANLLDSEPAREKRSMVSKAIYRTNFSEQAYVQAWNSVLRNLACMPIRLN